ncbi:MAG: prepilin-type N-terminal cleavage/methylation domain-containing protein, partial [Chloroflexi bacterium]
MTNKESTTLNNRGFTIVELLIVIVVIGILAAITIVAFNGIQNRGKAAAGQSL